MDSVWKDLRGFVGLPESEQATVAQRASKLAATYEKLTSDEDDATPKASTVKKRVNVNVSVRAGDGAPGSSSATPRRPTEAREDLPGNALIGNGIRLGWAVVRARFGVAARALGCA